MLVGREPEQALIARLVAGARVGQSGVLVVTGEAGIGKTALLEYASALAEDMNVLKTVGSQAEAGVAFGALLQLLRPALGMIDALPAPQAAALQMAFALRAGEPGDRFAVGAATLSLVSRYAEDRPLMLLVDDAHLLDRPSAEALVFVSRRLLADRVAVLMGERSTGSATVTGADLPELALTGLDEGSATSLLTTRGATPRSAEQISRLHRATGGNPLAMVELAGDLDGLARLPPHAPLPVPEVVVRSFARRTNELGDAARTALLVVVVADGDLALAAQACAAVGVDVAALGEAEAIDLVRVEVGVVEFRHPLVRSAVYGAASAEERRLVHGAVAAALPEHDLERRAWNLCEAIIGPDEEVAEALEAVGVTARGRSAYDVAATAFERASLLTPTNDSRRAERFVTAGECAWLAGQAGRAEELIDRGRLLGPTAQVRIKLRELSGAIAARTGSLEEARSILVAAVGEVEDSDPDAALLLVADAVDVCFYLGDADTAMFLVGKCEQLLSASTSARSRILGNMAAGIAMVLAGESGIERIRSAVDDLGSAPWFEDDPLRAAWMILGTLFLRESEAGRNLVRRVVEDRREQLAVGALPFLLFHSARDDATTHRWDEADIGYQESVRLGRETGQTTDLAMSLSGLAWLQARRGQAAACEASAAEASDLCRRHHIHLGTAWVGFARGELHLGLGATDEAIAELTALEDALMSRGIKDVDLSPGPELVDAFLRSGQEDRAAEVAQGYHRRAVSKGQPWAMARGERVLGSTCPAVVMDAHFARAAGLHQQTNDVFEEARTELAYGLRLRRARRRLDARPLLKSALETFERLGARPWADFAAIEVTATGVTASRRGDTKRDLMTAQELQIALLLGPQGRTTKQAAAALFLSPKTVEYHLRHVYHKLGIGSRAELTAALRE